jgi:hypothetical protein
MSVCTGVAPYAAGAAVGGAAGVAKVGAYLVVADEEKRTVRQRQGLESTFDATVCAWGRRTRSQRSVRLGSRSGLWLGI